MDDLVEWLRTQLDEDERIARGADPGPWNNNSLGRHDQSVIKLGAPTSTSLIHFDGSRAAANGAHVARHDPARMLREIEAKRRMLDWLARKDDWALDNNLWTWDSDDALCLLALPFADRPGYQEGWAP